MRFTRVLWVLAAFVFASVLSVQAGQAPGGQTQAGQAPTGQTQEDPLHPHTWCPTDRTDYEAPVTQTQVQIRDQAAMGRQLADQMRAPVLMTEKELMREIKSAAAEAVIKEVKGRGVDFDMTPGIEKKLRKANASEEVIEATRQAGPKVREQMAKMILGPNPGGVGAIPRDQARGFSAITGELDPDKTIARVDDFAMKYPHSLLLSTVYSFGANAYQQKGDVEKVVDYTGKSLQLNPDNLTSLILRLGMLPMPQFLRNHAPDRDKILQEALNDANHALQVIPRIPRQPNEADATYQKRLAEIASEVHGPLGTVYLELAMGAPGGPDKTELAKAEREFTTAVTTSSHPDPRDYFRLGETYALDGKLDDAMQAFRKAGGLGQGTLIKSYADQEIAQMKKRKAQGSVASNPSVVSLK